MKKALITVLIIIIALGLGAAGFFAAKNNLFNSIKITTATEEETTATESTNTTVATTTHTPEITVNIEKSELSIGETTRLKTALNEKNRGNFNIRYSSSDDNIAKVDSTGNVTAMSMGECKISAYLEDVENSRKEVTVKVSDKRIKDINILNNYLAGLPAAQSYTYDNNKKGTAYLSQCKIGDFNNDGSYELLIIYNTANEIKTAEIVTVSGNTTVSYKLGKGFNNIAEGGYTSYEEKIYLDQANTPCVILEYQKDSEKYTEKTAVLYTMAYNTLEEEKILYAKEPKEVNSEDGEYKKDNKKVTNDQYINEYTNLKKQHTMVEDYSDRMVSLGITDYTKASMPIDLGDAYKNRIKWKSSDESIAKVNSGGVITGVKAGDCEITGEIPVFSKKIVSITVKVTNTSDVYNTYLRDKNNQFVTGANGAKIPLYAFTSLDVDEDSTEELYVLYTGNNSCQINRVDLKGGSPYTETVISKSTKNGEICILEFFKDSMTNKIMLYEGYSKKENNKTTLRYYYDTLSNGKFEKYTSEYMIKNAGTNEEVYYIGGEKVNKDVFMNATDRYRKLTDWERFS